MSARNDPVNTRVVAWKRSPAMDFYAPMIEIHIGKIEHDYEAKRTRVSVVRDFVMETLDEGVADPQTPLKLNLNEAQVLMDSLWDCGLRPSEGSGSAGAMLATQEHLKSAQSETTYLRDINRRLIEAITTGKETP